MNQFILIFRGGATTQKGVSPRQLQEQLGNLRGSNPLEGTGRTIRGSEKAVTDGPFTKAKDLVSGYVLIGVQDLDQATQIALKCPIYEYDGSVEVRPVLLMEK